MIPDEQTPANIVDGALADVRGPVPNYPGDGIGDGDEPLDGPQFGEPGYSAVPPTPDADPDLVSCAPGVPVEPRSYTIGLPVTISVWPDGRVTAEVDLSEATDLADGMPVEADKPCPKCGGSGIGEGGGGFCSCTTAGITTALRPLYTDAELDEDVAAVEAAYDEGRIGLAPSFGTYATDGSAAVVVVLSVPNNPRSGDELTERDIEEGLRARLDEFYPWDDGYPEVPDVRSVTVAL